MSSKINAIKEIRQLARGIIKENNQISAREHAEQVMALKSMQHQQNKSKWSLFRARKMEIITTYIKALRVNHLKCRFLVQILATKILRQIRNKVQDVRLYKYTQLVHKMVGI